MHCYHACRPVSITPLPLSFDCTSRRGLIERLSLSLNPPPPLSCSRSSSVPSRGRLSAGEGALGDASAQSSQSWHVTAQNSLGQRLSVRVCVCACVYVHVHVHVCTCVCAGARARACVTSQTGLGRQCPKRIDGWMDVKCSRYGLSRAKLALGMPSRHS